jgi:FKBP-type peptidyl-prolyl cis-trans isomerase FkpA
LSAFGFVALVLLAALAAGCSNTPTAPSNFAPFGQLDLVVGTGDAAVAGQTVSVQYTGWLYDSAQTDNKGAQFSTTGGGTPFSFILGSSQVIAGWYQGVPGMKVGGVRRLVIPPSLAYGNSRNGPIPPNSTLVFEITLVSVQ